MFSSLGYPVPTQVILPLFPGKKAFGNLSADFVQQRAQDLQAYMDSVVVHPRILKASLDLVVFLSAQEQGLNAAKEYTANEARAAQEGAGLMASVLNTTAGVEKVSVKQDERFLQLCGFHHAVSW